LTTPLWPFNRNKIGNKSSVYWRHEKKMLHTQLQIHDYWIAVFELRRVLFLYEKVIPVFRYWAYLMRRLFQYFDIERTLWRLFQRRVVCTKFEIYVFIVFKSNKAENLLIGYAQYRNTGITFTRNAQYRNTGITFSLGTLNIEILE
jgi:hypothetical protein